jgi:hypothetical protein
MVCFYQYVNMSKIVLCSDLSGRYITLSRLFPGVSVGNLVKMLSIRIKKHVVTSLL